MCFKAGFRTEEVKLRGGRWAMKRRESGRDEGPCGEREGSRWEGQWVMERWTLGVNLEGPRVALRLQLP